MPGAKNLHWFRKSGNRWHAKVSEEKRAQIFYSTTIYAQGYKPKLTSTRHVVLLLHFLLKINIIFYEPLMSYFKVIFKDHIAFNFQIDRKAKSRDVPSQHTSITIKKIKTKLNVISNNPLFQVFLEKHCCFTSLTKASEQPKSAKDLNSHMDTQVGRSAEIEIHGSIYYRLENELPNMPPNHHNPAKAS